MATWQETYIGKKEVKEEKEAEGLHPTGRHSFETKSHDPWILDQSAASYQNLAPTTFYFYHSFTRILLKKAKGLYIFNCSLNFIYIYSKGTRKDFNNDMHCLRG